MPGTPGTESIWTSDTALPESSSLGRLSDVDVIIVGAGITGLTTGVLLQRAGFRTAVLEQDRIGSGETTRTSAHLTEYPDAGYERITTDFGPDGARAVAQSKRDAIDLIERFAAEIPCDFERVSGFLYSERTSDRARLEQELEAAQAAGLFGRLVGQAPLPFATAAAIEFPRQAQFHPGKYLAGLATLYVAAGGAILEGAHVRGVDEDGGRCRVRTDSWIAHATRVVAVTDAPIAGGALLDSKVRANRSYMLAARLRTTLLPHGLFWDTDEPYHYIRAAHGNDGPVLMIGGEDHRTGTDGEHEALQRLETYARERFAIDAIVQRWSGQIMEPVDGLPYIGPRESGSSVYLAGAYAGNGLTFGSIAAQVIVDMIRGVGSPYAELYAPDRMLAARQWAKYAAQNLPAAWTLVSDLLPYALTTSLNDLKPGEGRVVRLNGAKVAASRDLTGVLHAVSPTCTHMGCDVAWNVLERTWDCPCHGSRYTPDGQVIHGPATAPLESLGSSAGAAPVSKKPTSAT
jgi:glycine/D-amino acid oxidase-like deaminating enzyme/nitrite reductase/ring-hydroxylating ferredoxin subunit